MNYGNYQSPIIHIYWLNIQIAQQFHGKVV